MVKLCGSIDASLNSVIFAIISFGIFIRFYNLNYNDMWPDEMVTFWLSDPSINLKEILNRIWKM